MKEVKQFSKSYIFISALYVVLGVVLLVWPTMSVKMICYGIGIAMIVLGISYGIMYFAKENPTGFLQMDLVIGIVCLSFGVFVLLNQTFLGSVLPFAMGIILLLGAVIKIQVSINMKRLHFQKWFIVLICAILMCVFGIVLLCNPFAEERHMILFIGASLVADGVTNLATMLCVQVRVRTLNRMQRANPEASMEELLEQRDRMKQAGKKNGPAPVGRKDGLQHAGGWQDRKPPAVVDAEIVPKQDEGQR